jgi:alkanesulfonate monooxygenase SsuD/methylene tetrahydromethanopterin reductase-like flavin-dependent oxidoreductase (luciferase family)
MRIGLAVDLHAAETRADDVAWRRIRELVQAAEAGGLDLVVLPDHLAYRRSGDGDYAADDERVGVRESMTVLAAVAAVTETIDIGHSVVNAPYRTPTMVAHLAASLADISDGRYSLTIGAGNSFDYDQLGVDADHRVGRFEECVPIVADLLRHGEAHLAGSYWQADHAELAFRPEPSVELIVAAGAPRSMRVAARHGDAWNGWVPTEPSGEEAERQLRLLHDACTELGRDPDELRRTFDIAVDPLDLRSARDRSLAAMARLAELGADEVRCYPVCDATPEARRRALDGLVDMAAELE